MEGSIGSTGSALTYLYGLRFVVKKLTLWDAQVYPADGREVSDSMAKALERLPLECLSGCDA